MTTMKPMTRTRFRRLLASAATPNAESAQQLYDARTRGRLTGLFMVASVTGRHYIDVAVLTAESEATR